MSIDLVDIREEFSLKAGFKPIKMDRLGQVVLVAGKNGCGKTRLLTLIKSMVSQTQQLLNVKESYPAQRVQLLNNINAYRINKTANEQQLATATDNGSQKNLENQILGWEQNIKSTEEQIRILEEQNSSPLPLDFTDKATSINTVDFVPKNVKLEPYLNKSSHQWKGEAEQLSNIGVEALFRGTLPLLQLTQNRSFYTALTSSKATADDKKRFNEEYKRLNDLISFFLGCQLGHDDEGNCTIFDYQLENSGLSDGQSVLLQLCAAIFCQGGSLNNFTIFMDEPENHLHPSAVINMLDKIRELHPTGQFWIATHSIPLLSHFGPSCIWYVEEGLVRHAGKTPEKVLRSLLGDDEQIQKLRDFTSLPSELATNRFALECLLPPGAVLTDSDDPQTKQLHTQLGVLWNDKQTLRLLDFGAGKGRLIANLADQEPEIAQKLDYLALDRYSHDKDFCIDNIRLSYPADAEKRYFNSFETLRCQCDDGSFDVVALCNVLHEIPVDEWLALMDNLSQLLKADGYLLIVEDCRIPTGELPHKNGFVVLNTLHLKKLFSIGEKESKFIAHDARIDEPSQRNRLMAHLIPSSYLQNISHESIVIALEELKKSAIEKLKELRGKDPTYSNGLAHAFWVQQLANAELSLSRK